MYPYPGVEEQHEEIKIQDEHFEFFPGEAQETDDGAVEEDHGWQEEEQPVLVTQDVAHGGPAEDS